MTLEQAERLLDNADFKAFIELIDTDVKAITEDLVYQTEIGEIVRIQCKVIVLRGIKARLGHLIDSLKPELPASDQPTDSAA